jgi:acyl-CoA thioesterase FadM
MHAIGCIETGDTQKAVEHMSFIVAHYYHDYATQARPDSQVTPNLSDQIDDMMRLKLRGQIEQLARTNQIIAAQIHFPTNVLLTTP